LTGNWNTTLSVASLLPNTVSLDNDEIDVVAADMDQDGITDIGFYVPAGNAGQTGEWYWLISHDPNGTSRMPGSVNTLSHPFDPAPLGSDLFAQFGSADALPIVGLFDPPPDGGGAAATSPVLSGTATWIDKEYIDVLGRQPGPAELNYWVGQIDSGATPATVAQAIMQSDEHLAAVINQLYQQYLGRTADPGGTQYWSAIWRQNGGPELVQAGIIASPEYFKTAQTLYPNLSPDQAWVTALYHNILGRDVDPQGLTYWTDYIQTHSKQSVVLGFVTSDEYRLELINDWFVGYLGRSVDSSAAQYWLGQLQAGVGQDATQIGILSSDEYTQR
ncbi:MAG TPA: DUF4214 domain-containing protein, partial [Pirellulales bacterium]|nr:DUF4214 domain-containing protein [Pirellulales bacterium]